MKTKKPKKTVSETTTVRREGPDYTKPVEYVVTGPITRKMIEDYLAKWLKGEITNG